MLGKVIKMKKKIKVSKDLCFEFWEKYENADYLERDKLLLPIMKNVTAIMDIKEEKLRQHCLKITLYSYFDDLINYINYKGKK